MFYIVYSFKFSIHYMLHTYQPAKIGKKEYQFMVIVVFMIKK